MSVRVSPTRLHALWKVSKDATWSNAHMAAYQTTLLIGTLVDLIYLFILALMLI